MKKKLAAGRLWCLKLWVGGAMQAAGVAQAAAPLDVVIGTPAEAQAFEDAAPFQFKGQSLTVNTSFATSRAVSLHTLAPLFVGKGVQFELNGVVSSAVAPMAAPLEKRGPGILALRGENTYTSNTGLREGGLRAGGDAALGNSLYTLQQHAGTVLHLEPGARVMNFVQVSATRPGDEPLPGLEGRAEWRVDAGTAALANSVGTQVPVRKTGDGTLRLGRAVQGAGILFVDAGGLAVDGTVSTRVEVGRDARLEGVGRLAQARVGAGGMLAPGGRDAAATLGVWGDAVFDADSLFHVNAYADGRADLLEVGGTAELDGRVWAEAAAGEWAPEQRYRILHADGGLGDTRFAGAHANLAFLDPELDYDAGSVYLTLRRNDLDVGDVGETPDDEEVGDVIDPPKPETPKPPTKPDPKPDPSPDPDPQPGPDPAPDPDPDSKPQPEPQPGPAPEPEGPDDVAGEEEPGPPHTPLQEVVLGMTHDEARSALRQLSGSWHASVRSFLADEGRYVRQAVLASAADAWGAADDPSGRVSHPAANEGVRTWAQTYAAAGRRHALNGVEGDRHDRRGVVLGLDAPFGAYWRPGVVLAAQHAKLARPHGQASASMESLHAGVSAHGRWNGMRMTVALLRAWHRVDSRRSVSAGRLQEALGVSYVGRSWHAVVELAPHLRPLARNSSLAPYLRHEWVGLKLPSFTESGGLSAHGVDASHTGMHATTLGWRARADGQWQGRPAWLDADLGWRHIWGDTKVSSTQRFVGEGRAGHAPRAFSSQGQPLPRDTLAISLSAGVQPSRHARLSLRYTGLHGRDYRDHAAWADLRWAF